MCRFYSFLTDEKGNRYAMGHDIRVKIRNGKSDLREDSHASIAELWNIDEDKCNKYEFNPLTRELILDTQNLLIDDSELIDTDELMKEVKEAVPELIIKSIINPFKDIKFEGKITDEIIDLVKEWSEMKNSMEYSVQNSVGRSVRDSVVDSVWDSVRDSVRDSVQNIVRYFVWDSVYAYISSFFDIDYAYDFSPSIKLWEMGLVPSFDGKTRRLHSYKGIVWEEQL